MAQILLRASSQEIDEGAEGSLFNELRPDFNFICSNPTRACILHILVKSPELNHSMSVEEIASKLGKRHSVIIHHLEMLEGWKLVKVVKHSNYGDKTRRRVWGLNLECPAVVAEIYRYALKNFYTQKELESMCSINKNVRSD